MTVHKRVSPNQREVLYAVSSITGEAEYVTSTNHVLDGTGGGGGGGTEYTDGGTPPANPVAGASMLEVGSTWMTETGTNVNGTTPSANVFIMNATAGSPLGRVNLIDVTNTNIQGVSSAGGASSNLIQVGGASITLGQKTAANSLPITIASDQSTLTTNTTSTADLDLGAGTITRESRGGLLGNFGSTNIMADMSAYADDATGNVLATGIRLFAPGDSTYKRLRGDADGAFIQGSVASGSADSGQPLKIGGRVSTSITTPVSNATRVNAWFDEWGRQINSDQDIELGLTTGTTGLRDRLIAQRMTTLADSLADGIAGFWTQTTANGGGIASTGGEGRLTTSTNAAGSAQIVSTNVAYFPGQVAWLNSAIRFGDTGTAGNIRRIGMFTVSGTTPQEGFYYELNGTTLNAVTVKAGVATAVAQSSWTRNTVAPYTLTTDYVSFEIRYTANTVWFYINNVLRHQVSGTSASLTTSLTLPIAVTNVKTSGATDITFAIRNIGNGRFGNPGGVVNETGLSAVEAQAVGGGTPHDSVDSGNPLKVGGFARATAPTAVADSDRVNAWFTNTGALNTYIPDSIGGPTNITTQNLVPAGTATANSAVTITNSAGLNTLVVQVTGTYTGALSLQGTVDGSTWVTFGSSSVFYAESTGLFNGTIGSATTGTFRANVAGYTSVRVTALAAVTGTAVITLRLAATPFMVSQSTPLPAGTNVIGAITTIVPGTGTTNLGKAEDVAHGTGDVGIEMLAVRNDGAATSFTNANGDYSPTSVDTNGRNIVTMQAGTATLSNTAGSASSVTVLAANTARQGAVFVNDSTAIAYMKFGSTASTTSFTYKMAADATVEVPFGYTGIVTALWASATGSMRATEIT